MEGQGKNHGDAVGFCTRRQRIGRGCVRAGLSQACLYIGISLERQCDGPLVCRGSRVLRQPVDGEAVGIDAGRSLQHVPVLIHGKDPTPLRIAAMGFDKGIDLACSL